jgi:exoribonuclease-2
MIERGLLPDFPPQALAGRSQPYQNNELEALAKHCTEEEDATKKVEPQVGKSAAAMLLESRIGERFGALVTGASGKGTWVRILQPPVEGRLVSGFQGLDVGHRLRVQLIRTDVERGYIDFKKVEKGGADFADSHRNRRSN